MFFKGCPLRCVWCQNPESHKTGREIAFYQERCLRCFTCQGVCPEKSILAYEDQRIDHRTCSSCGKCLCVCPGGALQMVGVEWDGPALLDEILKDRDFFEDSGGGITLSGGEPLLQSRFLHSFLPLVHRERINVTLETCGFFPWEDLEPLLPYLDWVYFDLKLMDPELHRKSTGSPNGPILRNFERLAGVFPHLEARMPIVPGINDREQNIKAVAGFLKKNQKDRVHLLQYHAMGEAKLARIETHLKPLNLKGDAREALLQAKNWFETEGISVIINE